MFGIEFDFPFASYNNICVLPPHADPAQIVIAPESIAVNVGTTVLITCVASGDSPTFITWSNQSEPQLTNSSRVTIYEELVTEGGVTFVQSILEICSVQETDASNYTCSAENDLGTDNATFELAVNPEGKQRVYTLLRWLSREGGGEVS